MAGPLFLVEDDLMFGQRARAAAARLGVAVESLTGQEAEVRNWHEDDVVLLQATLRPERQEALIDRLLQLRPAPHVVAVTGHLETALRQRLRARGARVAAHSAMDRALARALGLRADGPGAHASDPPV
ncbi:MAG: hypothetical protein E6I88_08570 [Chloroflexi bacterium]|nr:MAG: hypothetical protein E6I88_08570 [Chloroflexota bacterium]TME45073.1 MAG: hypothetical protein E6I56_10285 [Chloroflexota bacterium]